jgi:glyoxylase-like metal-dependent hydrolase (beta-lactamase superfamily II)
LPETTAFLDYTKIGDEILSFEPYGKIHIGQKIDNTFGPFSSDPFYQNRDLSEIERCERKLAVRYLMQITDRIHALKIPFQITDPSGGKVPRFVYVYLTSGKRIFLIDSGVASSEKIILDYLEKTGRRPEEISLIILTHSHPDHIGAARAIKSISGCTIAAHAAEKSWIEDVELQERERPVPGFKSLVGGSVHVDRILQDGDVLDLDSLLIHVMHTPGHSSGSTCLWLPEEGALFSADAVPIPGSMPIYQDILASVRSIQSLGRIPGIKFLLSAWDEPRLNGEVYRVMDDGLEYLQRIYNAVLKVAGGAAPDAGLDTMELCRRTLAELGLPEAMANPLVARSFQASLKLRDQQDLLSDKR